MLANNGQEYNIVGASNGGGRGYHAGALQIDEDHENCVEKSPLQGCCPDNDSEKNKARCAMVVGIFMLIIGCLMAGFQFKRNMSWTSATGTIIGNDQCGSDSTRAPIIRYTVDGKTYTIKSKMCSDPPRVVGNDIAVLFDPDDPGHGMDASFIGVWLFPIVFVVFGIIIIVLPYKSLQSLYAFDESVFHAQSKQNFDRHSSENHNSPKLETYSGDFDIKYECLRTKISENVKIRLRSKNDGDGYNINGQYNNGARITEGFVLFSGNAWWIKENKEKQKGSEDTLRAEGAKVLTEGKFDFVNSTFTGTWRSSSGMAGSYIEFYGNDITKTFRDIEATVVPNPPLLSTGNPQTLENMLAIDIPMAAATPVFQDALGHSLNTLPASPISAPSASRGDLHEDNQGTRFEIL